MSTHADPHSGTRPEKPDALGPLVSVLQRAHTVADALGGLTDDPEMNRASGQILLSQLTPARAVNSGSGPLPRGF